MLFRSAPTPSLIAKYGNTHKDEEGKRVTPYGQEFIIKDELLNNLYPIYYETIYDLAKDGVDATDPLLAAYSFFGGGVNVQKKKEKTKSKKLEFK